MPSLQAAWRDYRDAVTSFSRPARLFLVHTLLAWAGYGVNHVLYNLYLIEAGFEEAFVGRVISLNGLGLAVAALPAGWLAERWGRRPCFVLAAVLFGTGHLVRALVLDSGVIYAGSFLAGVGQSLTAIAAAPFATEHSTPRERTHLFSAFFAVELLAGVFGNLVGGWMPGLLTRAVGGELLGAYRTTLALGAALDYASMLPILMLSGLAEARLGHERVPMARADAGKLWSIAANAALIGVGAGLFIPFMNLYFKTRFDCSSAQIGVFFSIAQVFTAIAMLIGPVIARRYGKLRTATASQLLSLPFLVTMGAERRLEIAVSAFWTRAVFMQASTPLIHAFVMESLPPALRPRATSLINLVWNLGWAASASLSGVLIVTFGYAVPFYVTAVLYGGATLWLYRAFRRQPETHADPPLSEEAKGLRGEGPATE